MMKFEIPKPNHYITWTNEDGTVERLSIGEAGELLYNDKELESLDDHKKSIAILLKAVCSIVQ